MKRLILSIGLLVFVVSCNRKEPDTSLPTPAPISIPENPDSAATQKDSHFFWIADPDKEDGLVMKKLYSVSKDSLSVAIMISRINDEYPEIQLKYKGVSNDTLFLKINKAAYLTQQMGSSGAEAYIAEVTFNMTEVDGINAVDLNFKRGDHAEPGVFTRTDFIFNKRNQ